MAWYISLMVFWNLAKAKRLQSPRGLDRGVQRQPWPKPEPPLPNQAPKTQCAGLVPQQRRQLPALCWLHTRRAGHRWLPQQTLVPNGAIPTRMCVWLSVRRVSYAVGWSGREEKFARRSCCAGEGKCPFLCVPVAQQEFPCCQQKREKVLLQATAAAPGIVPCCVLSPQASSACSEGGRTLLRAKPAGRVVSPPPSPPWPCSPGRASLQSLGGKGEGGGYCPNALSHVITPVQCPTQLLITTRVKLSSTVSE